MIAAIPVAVALVVTVGWQVIHRSSPLVRRWERSSLRRRTAGPLSVLDSGSPIGANTEVVVLLHGLGATGDYFGAFYDGLSRRRRLIIVDVLGFGRSLDEERTSFDVDAHVDALDQALTALDLHDSPVVLAAHSMSSAIALTWADRHRGRTQQVFLWGPPVYPDRIAAESVVKNYGVMGRLFALDTRWAERACRVNCMHRGLSGRVMAMMAPRWPVEVSGAAGEHTWDAYQGSLRSLVLEFDWTTVLPATVPVTVVRGADDPIGDREFLDRIRGTAAVIDVPGSDHHVALQHPELIFDALDQTM